jgi:8-oxo-dGTP pyrophosphatase MutT (NUDIX family)
MSLSISKLGATIGIMTEAETLPEFGIKRENEERRDGGCGIVFDPKTKKYAVGKQHENGAFRLFSGGVSDDEDIQEGILREVTEESGLYDFGHIEKIGSAFTHYHNTLRKINRIGLATCFLIILKSDSLKPVELEDHEKFSLAWATDEELFTDWRARSENKDYDHWIYFMEKAVARIRKLGY